MTVLDAPAIDCRNLVHSYGRVHRCGRFQPRGAAGETVGLLGPNGAGKTTVVRVLTTLTPVQRGQVEIFGTGLSSPHDGYQAQHRLCATTAFDRIGADRATECRFVRATLRRAAFRTQAPGGRSAWRR